MENSSDSGKFDVVLYRDVKVGFAELQPDGGIQRFVPLQSAGGNAVTHRLLNFPAGIEFRLSSETCVIEY